MTIQINAKQLRASLPEIVRRVGKGAKLTVIYRSRPAFRIVPIDDTEDAVGIATKDSLYRAPAVGRSNDGGTSAEHDEELYPR
jgi:prevent-host-death family protein